MQQALGANRRCTSVPSLGHLAGYSLQHNPEVRLPLQATINLISSDSRLADERTYGVAASVILQ